jgi:4-hydroxy-tetrahydrodipicolinate synthase
LIFSGDDETACDLILQGANGAISVTANIAPAENSAMCAAALAGDEATAHRLDELLQGLHKNLFLESNPIPVKWALQEMGLIGPGIRLPLTPFAEKFHEDLRQSMRQAGALT